MQRPISDNPVYRESYYNGGTEEYTDETYILLADGAGCSTPELIYVPAVAGEWDFVGYYAPPSDDVFDPWGGVSD